MQDFVSLFKPDFRIASPCPAVSVAMKPPRITRTAERGGYPLALGGAESKDDRYWRRDRLDSRDMEELTLHASESILNPAWSRVQL